MCGEPDCGERETARGIQAAARYVAAWYHARAVSTEMRGARRQLTPFDSVAASLDVFLGLAKSEADSGDDSMTRSHKQAPVRRCRRDLVLTEDHETLAGTKLHPADQGAESGAASFFCLGQCIGRIIGIGENALHLGPGGVKNTKAESKVRLEARRRGNSITFALYFRR